MKTETIFFLAGVLFTSLAFVPLTGAAEMDMIVLTLLALIYFPGGFYFFSDKTIKTQKLALSIPAGLALLMIIMGVLFRVLYLSGSNEMFMLGVPFAFVMLLATILAMRKQIHVDATVLDSKPESIEPTASPDLSRYYNRMALRLAVWLAIGIGGYFVNQESLVRFKYRNNPERAEKIINSGEAPSRH